jgi:hypothetical protein
VFDSRKYGSFPSFHYPPSLVDGLPSFLPFLPTLYLGTFLSLSFCRPVLGGISFDLSLGSQIVKACHIYFLYHRLGFPSFSAFCLTLAGRTFSYVLVLYFIRLPYSLGWFPFHLVLFFRIFLSQYLPIKGVRYRERQCLLCFFIPAHSWEVLPFSFFSSHLALNEDVFSFLSSCLPYYGEEFPFLTSPDHFWFISALSRLLTLFVRPLRTDFSYSFVLYFLRVPILRKAFLLCHVFY